MDTNADLIIQCIGTLVTVISIALSIKSLQSHSSKELDTNNKRLSGETEKKEIQNS